MKTFTAHLFQADYQHMVEKQLVNNLPIDHCLVVMDFSENASLDPQVEIQSAHYTVKQVTVHPIHIVRHTAENTIDNPRIVKESLIVLSDCLTHNTNAVYVFTNQMILHFENNPGPFAVKVIHRTQYQTTVQLH